MIQTVQLQAPSDIGGKVQAPNGTYSVPAGGIISVDPRDVPYLLGLGFQFVSGGSGSNEITLTADTDIAAGTSVSVNSSGHAVQTWGCAPQVAETAQLFPAQAGTWANQLTPPFSLILSSTLFVTFTPSNGGINIQPGCVSASISGSTIEPGTINTDTSFANVLSAVRLSATTFAYYYTPDGSNFYARIGTVAAGAIELGTPQLVTTSGGFGSPSDGFTAFAPLSATSFALVYLDEGGIWIVAATITGSGTGAAITLGTPVNVSDLTSIKAIPVVMSSTEVVVVYSDGSNNLWGVAASISTRTVTLGTPAEFSGANLNNSFYAANVDSTRFVMAWTSTGGSNVYNGLAAVGSLSGGAITFGTKEIINSGTETIPAISVLSTSEIAFYAFWTAPAFASLSGTTLDVTLGAPLPLAWHSPSNQSGTPTDLTAPEIFTSFQSMAAVGSNVIFQDGAWSLYEANSSGAISPPVRHKPGFYNYEIYPLTTSSVLATFTNYDGSISARVVTYNPLNASPPIGFAASAATEGNPCTITTSQVATGLSDQAGNPLVPGETYHHNGDGSIITGNDTGYKAGVALTASTLLIAA